MNKILKMVGTASLVGSMLVFAGCGGGGSDDNDTVTPPATTNEVTVTTSGSSAATALKDIYKFSAVDGINYTITGFAAGDVLSFPAGSTPEVENAAFDDKVVVQWVSNGQVVRATLAGLSTAVDSRLTSIAAFNTEYGAGTIASY